MADGTWRIARGDSVLSRSRPQPSSPETLPLARDTPEVTIARSAPLLHAGPEEINPSCSSQRTDHGDTEPDGGPKSMGPSPRSRYSIDDDHEWEPRHTYRRNLIGSDTEQEYESRSRQGVRGRDSELENRHRPCHSVELDDEPDQERKRQSPHNEEPEDDEDLERRQSARSEKNREGADGQVADLIEMAAPAPVERVRDWVDTSETKEADAASHAERSQEYQNDDAFLTEVAAPKPTEDGRDEEKGADSLGGSLESDCGKAAPLSGKPSEFATEVYIVSYLIFFSFLGTLARLGVEAITRYPSAPVISPVLWANLGGSLFLGFLKEDRWLFRQEWGQPDSKEWSFHPSKLESKDEAVRQSILGAHAKIKKTLPLFIGFATGFCGCFTSFSSFVRDAFLALTNALPSTGPGPGYSIVDSAPPHRNGGFSFEATVAVLIVHVAVSLGALQIGAHLALALDEFTPTIPVKFTRKVLDPCMVFIAFGCWLGAVLLSIWPPRIYWRDRATFPLVFAPIGCLLRFYASKHLNARIPSFPMGTFSVNMFGTAVIGMCYDLQHSGTIGARPGGNVLYCQVLFGVMEGFCGCATTVSTWVLELHSLRRRHAWTYGLTSLAFSLGLLVVIMGSFAWTTGFGTPLCG